MSTSHGKMQNLTHSLSLFLSHPPSHFPSLTFFPISHKTSTTNQYQRGGREERERERERERNSKDCKKNKSFERKKKVFSVNQTRVVILSLSLVFFLARNFDFCFFLFASLLLHSRSCVYPSLYSMRKHHQCSY